MLSILQIIILGTSLSAVIEGTLFVVVPYRLLVHHLAQDRLNKVEPALGLFVLRTAIYMLVGGLIISTLGFVAVLFILPFVS